MPTEPRTKLHRFMLRHGITDERLAGAAGLSLRGVIYIRNGEQSPRIETAAQILHACLELSGLRRVPVTHLFDFNARKAA